VQIKISLNCAPAFRVIDVKTRKKGLLNPQVKGRFLMLNLGEREKGM
jgi:hypothetical protein